MEISLEEIIRLIKEDCISNGNENRVITDLLFDSRRLNNADNTLFFSINSPSNSGNKYIDELYNQGVRCFVVEKNTFDDFALYPYACFIISNNPIHTLQKIAKIKRDSFKNRVIAITGSNGKTIVKDWIIQLIDKDLSICHSPRSYNSQIGVCVSLWNLSKTYDIGIFEAGISQKGEMSRLEEIIRPEIGVFTNIGDAHSMNFSTIEEKIQEKLILFKNSNTIIYPNNNNILDSEIKQIYKDKRLLDWGKKSGSYLRIIDIQIVKGESIISFELNNNKYTLNIPFTDGASIENAINSFLTCFELGIDIDKLILRSKKLQALEMRLELKEGINGNQIINDAYSSDLMSLDIGLNFLNQQSNDLEKVLILSDITQSYKNEKELFLSINKLLINNKVSKLVGIGEGFIRNSNLIKIENEVFPTTEDFLRLTSLKNFKNQIILIKGARSFGFERISRFFEKKAHETVLEINLSSITHNTNYFKSKLKDNVKIMAMVKALSYGCGGVEIASVLASHNVDYLAVAFADEGVELRNNGIKLPIMVMSPEKESISKIIHHNLEPEVYSLGILNKLIIAHKEYCEIIDNKPISIHIKLDTGMHRLGMERDDIDSLIKILKANPQIRVKSIFSHFSASDNPEFDYFTLEQISLFNELSQKIMKEFDYKILKHICNSSGISRFPQAHFDMVRLGIGMYGIGVNKEEEDNLKYVHKLKTTITQIRTIEKDETVGYNRNHKVKEKTKIGIIPIGYADGLSRRRGNGVGRIYVNGYLAPIIGNICMDMCMIDLSGIEASERDDVIIFGEEYPVHNIAQELGTISYEVFTSISTRVKRVYYQE